MTTNQTPVEYLPWDSDFFGFPIARIKPHRIDADELSTILVWCSQHHITCLYFLCDAHERDAVRLVEDRGFRLVDIRITLETSIKAVEQTRQAMPIRLHMDSDIPKLREITRHSYRNSRFYYDPNFSDELCDRFYETWIENSCKGYADAVLVALESDEPIGFITCHLRDEQQGEIGLVGVANSMRGHGTGQHLVNAALQWFAEHHTQQVSVVTQGRNIAAQRLYQRSGFVTAIVQLWYHYWLIPIE